MRFLLAILISYALVAPVELYSFAVGVVMFIIFQGVATK